MTTIAYRDGILAADSLSTFNGARQGSVNKIFRLNGVLIGGCGELNVVSAFYQWVCLGMKADDCPVSKGSESMCFVIRPDGVVMQWCDRQMPIVERSPFYAWGSGAEFATGAMEMGADARRAVEAAIVHDTSSGAPIRTLTH